MDIKDILAKCDHTLLAQGATWAEIKAICDDGMKYGTASVCIPASHVKQAKEYVGDKLAICTVIGFPNGYSTTAVKVFECRDALENGADEIDTVINIGHLKDGLYPTDGMKLGRQVQLGEGRANLPAIVDKLEALGYTGPYTIECELKGDDKIALIREAREYMLDIFAKREK